MTHKGYTQTKEHIENVKNSRNHKPDCQCICCKAKRGEYSGKNNGMWKESVPFTCPVCGTTKYYKPGELKNKKSCSKKCASSGENNKLYGKTGKDHPAYKEKVQCICKTCGKIQYVTINTAKTKKYCSPECQYAAGQSKEMIAKISGENNITWKGDDVGYRGRHYRIVKLKGPAKNYKCIDCAKQASDWSNIDHLYKRNLDDYSPRCTSCHRIYDNKLQKSNV